MKGKWGKMQSILERTGGKITDREIKSIFNWFTSRFIIFIIKRDGENWKYYRRDANTGTHERHLRLSTYNKPTMETVFEIITK